MAAGRADRAAGLGHHHVEDALDVVGQAPRPSWCNASLRARGVSSAQCHVSAARRAAAIAASTSRSSAAATRPSSASVAGLSTTSTSPPCGSANDVVDEAARRRQRQRCGHRRHGPSSGCGMPGSRPWSSGGGGNSGSPPDRDGSRTRTLPWAVRSSSWLWHSSRQTTSGSRRRRRSTSTWPVILVRSPRVLKPVTRSSTRDDDGVVAHPVGDHVHDPRVAQHAVVVGAARSDRPGDSRRPSAPASPSPMRRTRCGSRSRPSAGGSSSSAGTGRSRGGRCPAARRSRHRSTIGPRNRGVNCSPTVTSST